MSGAAGQAAYDALVAAVDDARTFRIDAIATAPVNKEAFALAGLPWKGHTDLLGYLTGVARPVMFFHAERLKVALATVHIALADVAQALTAGRPGLDDPDHGRRPARLRRRPAAPRRRRPEPALW